MTVAAGRGSRVVAPLQAHDPVNCVLQAYDSGDELLLPTSGTSGASRHIQRTTESWWVSFPAYSELTGVVAGARLWLPGPLSATLNLFAAVHATVVGAELVDDPAEATHSCVTPAHFRRFGSYLSTSARICVAGGSLPQRQWDPRVVHYYGAAELSLVAGGSHADDLRPMPGVDVEVRSDVIWVRSAYVALGYRDDLSGEGVIDPIHIDANGFATVGDRGEMVNERLVVHGRPDHAIVAGVTVPLAVVQAVLERAVDHPFGVYAQAHPVVGEVVAVALTDPDDRGPAEWAVRNLPTSHRPRRWKVVDELPLTAAGKIDTGALRDGLRNRAEHRTVTQTRGAGAG